MSADSVVAGVAATIRTVRERRGMSTRELAHLAGVSQSLLSNVENGRAQPSVRTIYALAEALGVGPGALLPSVRTATPEERAHLPELSSDPVGPVRMRLLHASPDSALEAYLIEQRAGFRDPEQYGHTGEDLIHVLSGRVTLVCGASRLDLAAGDTVRLDGTTPHSFTTPRGSDVRALIITRRDPRAFG